MVPKAFESGMRPDWKACDWSYDDVSCGSVVLVASPCSTPPISEHGMGPTDLGRVA